MSALIRPLETSELALYQRHALRHRAESGRDGDIHFMPFAPNDVDGPRGLEPDALSLGLRDLGWQRYWVVDDGGEFVGDVNLKGDKLKTGLHRCELGIGLERSHRRMGLGRRLMLTAIDRIRIDGQQIDDIIMSLNVG
jgi:GNAT superfamily N-acetyltransferase